MEAKYVAATKVTVKGSGSCSATCVGRSAGPQSSRVFDHKETAKTWKKHMPRFMYPAWTSLQNPRDGKREGLAAYRIALPSKYNPTSRRGCAACDGLAPDKQWTLDQPPMMQGPEAAESREISKDGLGMVKTFAFFACCCCPPRGLPSPHVPIQGGMGVGVLHRTTR